MIAVIGPGIGGEPLYRMFRLLCRETDYGEASRRMCTQAAPRRGGTFSRALKHEGVERVFGPRNLLDFAAKRLYIIA
jgi:hypothetical protein